MLTVPTKLLGSGSSPSRVMSSGRIGQYEIIRMLGLGGMGEVHLARDLRLGRLVAIKLMTTQRPGPGERFLAEARATARCHHENIVVIYEVGEHEGRPYMVLEHIEGQTLRQWLQAHTAAGGPHARVSPARAVELMLPVVRALAYAHEQGIVHRDLKPENIMLTRAGVIKVLDFGIAKSMSAPDSEPVAAGSDARSGTLGTSLAGTLPYMSPEQITLEAVDHRTDVWAAGIMMFELVAGVHPVLEGRTPLVVVETIADPKIQLPSVSERVPEIGALGAIIDRCLIKDPVHRTASARALLAELEALALGQRAVAVGDDGSPFAGLAAFQEADAGRFFGRDQDIAQLVAQLRSQPLVAVVGPSGAGKSSLVRAGVIPALKRSGEGWDTLILRPGREPLAALAQLLGHPDGAPVRGGARATLGDMADRAALRSIVEQLRAEPGYLGARLRARATSRRRRILLFVDQLEELYTLGVPAPERAAFRACLAAMADDVSSPLRVLISMRSDFLDRLTEDRRLGAEVAQGLVLLPPMDRDGMREALLRPVLASEHRFEPPGLVDRMVDDLAETPGALPLLQFTAARLWERRDRDRRLLTGASYVELGGVAGTLAAHADAVLAGMSSVQQALARAVIERLVTPERTRALVSVAQLYELQRMPGAVDDLIQRLATMRLVVIERGGEDADRTVELIHESLIARWPTLVRWLDENQDDAAMMARLRAAAHSWERGDRAAGLLWTGQVAAEARAWRQRYRTELPPVEQRFLEAVLAAADRARWVRRRLFGGLMAAAVAVAAAMGWLAWTRTEEATRARDAARVAAMRALPEDPTTQLALLREIEDLRAPPPAAVQEAWGLLHAGLALAILRGHQDGVLWAEFSPDGRRIVSAGHDRTVRIWSADGRGEPVVLRGHTARVLQAVFSPDGQRVASASDDRTVRVWSADGRGDPVVLRGHTDVVWSVAFSPDGRRIVSGSHDGTVRIWSADGGAEPLVLRGHTEGIASVAFSPDGRHIASAGNDGVRVWSGDGGAEPLVLRGHRAGVDSVAFSPDGRRIVSAGHDGTVRVWNADMGAELVVLRHDDERVMSAAFSPDGRRIVSASRDKMVRVWSADGRGEPVVLRGHGEMVISAAFSPDGRRIVSASYDKTVRVWNAEVSDDPRILRGHDNEVSAAVFSSDGRRIFSASHDRSVREWSVDGSSEPRILYTHRAGVMAIASSPDGQRIASGCSDSTMMVWSADRSGGPLVLTGHTRGILSVGFSPDSRRIVSGSEDATVRVWNADGRGEPRVLRGHDARVLSAAFSPDGQRIVSASDDRTVRIWSADERGEPRVLCCHDARVRSAAFSPDGGRIVSASDDRTVRVWSADGRGEPRVLRGHGDWVLWAEFSPDGRRIVSASKDKTIRIWQADGTGEPVILVGHELWVLQARFSPDGQRIVSASPDRTVRVWHDLAGVTLDDPRLWTATSYCMSIERRIELLGVTEAQARRDHARCLERVERARTDAR